MVLISFDLSNKKPNAPQQLLALIGFTESGYRKDLTQKGGSSRRLRNGGDDGIGNVTFSMDSIVGSLVAIAATTMEGMRSSRKARSSTMISEIPVDLFNRICFTRRPEGSRYSFLTQLRILPVAATVCRYINFGVLGPKTWGACRRTDPCPIYLHRSLRSAYRSMIHPSILLKVIKHRTLRPP